MFVELETITSGSIIVNLDSIVCVTKGAEPSNAYFVFIDSSWYYAIDQTNMLKLKNAINKLNDISNKKLYALNSL